MKTKLLMLLFLISTYALAQKNVAVYVTGGDDVPSGVKKVFGSELVAAIVKNNDYKAVERTSEFLNVISREQGYQHSGNVEDSQIRELGRQFGVEYVCVAEITDFTKPSMSQSLSEYYISARFIDVEKATIVATAKEYLQMNGGSSIEDIVKTAENLSYKLVGKSSAPVGRDYSTYLTKNAKGLAIMSIDNTGADTKVTCVYLSLIGTNIRILPTSYIKDKETNIKYHLLSADGIGVSPQSTNIAKNSRTVFTLHFQKIPSSTSLIDIIEPDGWRFYGVSLKPYGVRDYFLFADKSSELEQEAREVKTQNTINTMNAVSEGISAVGESVAQTLAEINRKNEESNFYELSIMNTHPYPLNIYIANRFIGVVPKYGAQTFRLSTNVYGRLESVQASGYLLSPSRGYANITRQPRGMRLTLRL